MSRSWRRRLVVLTLTATIVGVVGVAPALATWTPGAPSSPGNVTPTVVGDGKCSSVGSVGTQFKINKLYVDGTYVISGGPTITIDAASNKKSFAWTISPGFQVHDVTVLGLLTPFNHYDYGETPRSSDGNLHAPLIGTTSTFLGFGYFCWSAVEVEPETFSISGRKIHDENANGVSDEGELGLDGWTIELSQGETVIEDVTAGGGFYSFSGLEAGEYQVCEVLQDGWVQTSPGGCHSVTVGPNATADFLNVEAFDMCEEDASTPEGNTSATFTLVGECDEGQSKVATVAVEGDEIVFIPNGDGTAEYQGTLTFRKHFSDSELLMLFYDPDGEGFDPVPACEGENQLPDTGDNWCFFGVDLSPVGGGFYDVTWQVFGEDDPRFK